MAGIKEKQTIYYKRHLKELQRLHSAYTIGVETPEYLNTTE